MLYDDSGQRTLAEEHWQSACNCHNAPGWSWILRGANLASLEKFEEAEACYQLASQKDDGVQDEAYLNIGRAMCARGKYVDAEAAFQKALEITPDYEEAWVGMRSIEGLAEALVATNQLLCNRLK